MDKRSTILQQHPSTLLGLKLTTKQQVLCCFLVPAIVNCIIYIIDFASNVAVVERHFEESNVKWAISTLLIMYFPSVVYFIFTVSYIEEWNKQYEQSATTKWFLARLLYLVAFPVLGIYRYAKIIFWSIEAFFRHGREQEEALRYVIRPSHIELYFFLQAYLQGIPQAVMQLAILFIEHNDDRETDSMQVLCIASSLMIVAITTVSFQRFESQRILGRLKPWAEVPPSNETTEQENNQQEIINQTQDEESECVNYISDDEQSTPYLQPRVITEDQTCDVHKVSLHSNDIANVVPVMSKTQSIESFPNDVIDILHSEVKMNSSSLERRENNGDHLLSISLPPPPPIPKSPPAPLHPSVKKSLEFPTRKIPVKGLEQDDLLGKSVSFLMWLLFLTSRIISLVSFFHFYFWAGFVISILHFSITLLLIHTCFKTIPTLLIKLSLAVIFCFCLIERKIKFTNVYLLYTIFFFTVSVENISVSTVWYVLAEWEGWWYNYTYFVIWGCQVCSVMCILMYMYMFKPKSRIFYPSDTT